eukprot:5637117-Alexandrium_andersonii.AAC.1
MLAKAAQLGPSRRAGHLSDLHRSVAVASVSVAARSQRRRIDRNKPRYCFASSGPVASRSQAPVATTLSRGGCA